MNVAGGFEVELRVLARRGQLRAVFDGTIAQSTYSMVDNRQGIYVRLRMQFAGCPCRIAHAFLPRIVYEEMVFAVTPVVRKT